MIYAAELSGNGMGGFLVQFADVPEALTEGSDRAEALANAAEALEVALLGRMKDGEDVPVAKAKSGTPVALPAQSAVKLAFYQAFKASGMTQSALARKLGKDEAEIRRMLDPYHQTKLRALDEAIRALGRRLSVGLAA